MDEMSNDNTVDATKLLYSLTHISTSQGHHQVSITTFKKRLEKLQMVEMIYLFIIL
jgi:hypothetical protein